MDTSRVSSKGQIVIPKAIREALDLEAGTEVEFVREGNSARMKPIRRRKPADPKAGYGLAGYEGPTVTLEHMQEGVKKRARESR